MERGAGASNLDIQFNLKVTRTNEFTVEKEIPEGVDERFANQTYKFQATYMDGTTERPLRAGIENVCTAVVYKGTDDPVTVDDNGYFYLKAGEAAVFQMVDESIRYNVKEVGIDSELIEQVDINGQQVTVTNGTAEAGYAMVEDRTQVIVTNHPKTQNLLITKHLTEDSAPLVEGENPVFEFRVYLETTVTNPDGTTQQRLVPYSYAPYYLIKEVSGETHYFTLTGVNNAPVDKGTTKTVCSTTGRSGSINSIPPEYTIIIPDLVVGTNFYVEERRDNIPEGYEFVREELKDGTYDPESMYTGNPNEEIIQRILARDETDHQDFDPKTIGRIKNGVDAESHIYNRKPVPTTDITIKKVDKDKINDDPTDLLKGASFTITKYTTAEFRSIETSWEDNGSKTLNDEKKEDGTYTLNGSFEFKDIPEGFYMLDEIKLPDGYVKLTSNPTFEVKKKTDGFEVNLLNAPEGMVRLINNTATIIVANTPGAALPNTGGPGTNLIYLLGFLMTGLAGAGLVMKRRRRNAA